MTNPELNTEHEHLTFYVGNPSAEIVFELKIIVFHDESLLYSSFGICKDNSQSFHGNKIQEPKIDP